MIFWFTEPVYFISELPDISTQWSQLVQVYFTAIEHEAGLVRREALTGLCTIASTLNSFERPKLYDLLGALIDKEEVSDVRYVIC